MIFVHFFIYNMLTWEDIVQHGRAASQNHLISIILNNTLPTRELIDLLWQFEHYRECIGGWLDSSDATALLYIHDTGLLWDTHSGFENRTGYTGCSYRDTQLVYASSLHIGASTPEEEEHNELSSNSISREAMLLPSSN